MPQTGSSTSPDQPVLRRAADEDKDFLLPRLARVADAEEPRLGLEFELFLLPLLV